MAKCGVKNCDFQGSTEKYLKHKCVTGFKPTDIEHLDASGTVVGEFSRASEAALKRGAERKEKEEK